MTHDVFISYYHKDKAIADAICHRFEDDKIKCWMAPRDIVPGENWAESIASAIPRCKVFILIFSSHSNMSKQVLREVELAVTGGLIIIPVRIEDIKLSGGMAYYLSTVHWIDAVDEDIDKKLHSLSSTVSDTLKSGEKLPPNRKPIGISSSKMKIISRTLLAVCIVIAFVVIIGVVLYFSGKTEKDANLSEELLETEQKETYNILLNLEFDDDEDKQWIHHQGNREDTYEYRDGKLYVYGYGHNIDYIPNAGAFVHFKAILPPFSAVSLGGYRIGSEVGFESAYHNEQVNEGYSSEVYSMEGIPFRNEGQYVDAILYMNPEMSAVYAIDIDEQSGKIAYYACRTPIEKENFQLVPDIEHFEGENPVIVESITIVNGSLKTYLNDNFDTYRQNKDMVDEFLDRDVETLPEIKMDLDARVNR